MSMDAPAAETTFRATLRVAVPVEQAFQVFTEQMGSWWPADHHIGQAPLAQVVVEPRAGGRWFEVGADGAECPWGRVLAWGPPDHVALAWHLDPRFEYDPDESRASRVDVHFRPVGPAMTAVELVHSGLERHGAGWQLLRDAIASPEGWPAVVASYGRLAEA
jgi:uncharacterized protein YndB with AHSA1/START domain